MIHDLVKAIASARNAVGYSPADARNPATRMAPAVVIEMPLASAVAPSVGNGERYNRAAVARPAGEMDSLVGRVLETSRVARAGARIITIDSAPKPIAVGNGPGGVIAFEKRPSQFSVLTAPEPVEATPPGSDAPLTPQSILRADIDLGEEASHALHFSISRAEARERSADEQAFELSRSIAMGIAQLADTLLLQAIVAATPDAFTLAKAAEKNLFFGELRAMVGTSGTAATVNAAGNLVAAGIAAELTDRIEDTVVGAFTRTAVAVEQTTRVVIKRTGLQGEMDIVVFVNAQPLLPDTGAFWLAA